MWTCLLVSRLLTCACKHDGFCVFHLRSRKQPAIWMRCKGHVNLKGKTQTKTHLCSKSIHTKQEFNENTALITPLWSQFVKLLELCGLFYLDFPDNGNPAHPDYAIPSPLPHIGVQKFWEENISWCVWGLPRLFCRQESTAMLHFLFISLLQPALGRNKNDAESLYQDDCWMIGCTWLWWA